MTVRLILITLFLVSFRNFSSAQENVLLNIYLPSSAKKPSGGFGMEYYAAWMQQKWSPYINAGWHALGLRSENIYLNEGVSMREAWLGGGVRTKLISTPENLLCVYLGVGSGINQSSLPSHPEAVTDADVSSVRPMLLAETGVRYDSRLDTEWSVGLKIGYTFEWMPVIGYFQYFQIGGGIGFTHPRRPAKTRKVKDQQPS